MWNKLEWGPVDAEVMKMCQLGVFESGTPDILSQH